ncbi:MAG: polysaccharide biosynthesis protein [Eubacteriales bacterium]|nr:polysaccharide biosynthesis protein [Eubacteriales bacterium]
MIQKKTVLQGAALLTAAGIAGRIIGFFYRIFLSRTIGAEGVGIYQLIFPLYALSFSLTVSGIQTAISRFVSAKTAANDQGGARKIFHIGLFFSVGLSLVVSFILLQFHTLLASNFVKEPRSAGLLRLLAYAIPFGSVHACINGYYYGLKQAKVPAAVEVLEHIVRLGSVVLISRIYAQQGAVITPSIAVYGIIMEELFAALISAAALTRYSLSRPPLPAPVHPLSFYVREMLTLSVPLTLNRVLVNVLQSIEALMIPLQLRMSGMTASASLSVYGVLTGMALPLILFPTALTSSLCTMLLPVISEAQATGQLLAIRTALKKICLACLALGGACFLCFFLFGGWLGNLLFHDALAGSFIRALFWICPLLYLNPALFAVLNGLGKTAQTFIHNLTGVLIRIIFIVFAIPQFGISGFFIGMLVNQIIVFLLSMRTILRELKDSHPHPCKTYNKSNVL